MSWGLADMRNGGGKGMDAQRCNKLGYSQKYRCDTDEIPTRCSYRFLL